jgi:hypothetical protein
MPMSSDDAAREPERPVDRARRLVPPGAWLNRPEFERAREFVFEAEPIRDEQGWILYAPIDCGQTQPADPSRD